MNVGGKKNNVIFGQVVTERNMSLLFSGERDSDHYDALFPAEEEEKLCIFEEVCFYSQLDETVFCR
jgi:hypothetical protein